MQTEEVQEEEVLLHELPLETLLTWTRWWHLTARVLPLVFKRHFFGVVGAYLNKQKLNGNVSARVRALGTYWSDLGRELKRLADIRRTVV